MELSNAALRSLRVSNYMEASKLSSFMTWFGLAEGSVDELKDSKEHCAPLNVQIGCLIADPSMLNDPYAFLKDEILLKHPRVSSISACSCVFYLFQAYKKTLERFKDGTKPNAFHIQLYLQQEYTDLVKQLMNNTNNNNLHSSLYNELIRSSSGHRNGESCHTCPSRMIHVPLTISNDMATDASSMSADTSSDVAPMHLNRRHIIPLYIARNGKTIFTTIGSTSREHSCTHTELQYLVSPQGLLPRPLLTICHVSV